MTHKFEDCDKKYKLYFLKSDRYIKDREAKLHDLRAECDSMSSQFAYFEQQYLAEKQKVDSLTQELLDLKTEKAELERVKKRQKLEIIDYEERYKGIDIRKMHEQ